MNILFLTHRLPYAPNRGDRIRAFHVLRHLKTCGDVTLFSLVHDADEESRAGDLGDLAARVCVARVPRLTNLVRAGARLPTNRPLTLELLHAPKVHPLLETLVRAHPPDVVLAYCSSMARYAMEPPLNQFPFVLDMVDVDSQKWGSLSVAAPWPQRFVYRRESVCLAAFERTAIRAARITLVVNDREALCVRQLVPDADVRVVQNGIDLTAFAPNAGPFAEPQVVFCGVMNYAPNEAAALRLARGIWPLVRKRRPDAKLLLVGASPTAAIAELPNIDASIRVTGSVPDVRPYLWQSALSVVPLTTARGVQNKVLEALAAGLPVVVTKIVADGLPSAALPGCMIVDTDEACARATCELLSVGATQRRELAGRAQLSGLTWARQLDPLCGIVRETASAVHTGETG